jgi:peptidyl-tRNA hydrolase, PTH2 family
MDISKMLKGLAMEHKMVFVVRADLKMSPGKIAAQVSHAAVLCAMKAQKQKPNLLNEWVHDGYKKVVLKVDSLEELLAIESSAKLNDLITELIVDAGRTEVPVATATVLGIGPDVNENIDIVTGKLALL